MVSLLERLGRGDTLLADGGMGTMLFERGLAPGNCPESLTLADPEVLEEISRLYLDAGAEILQTNTFGASSLKLADFGLEKQTEALNSRAVEIVKGVAAGRAIVSGSVGPSGKLLVPYGDTDPETLRQSYERQIRALVEAGVDVICIETMMDVGEASLVVEVSKNVSPKTPVMATMTFQATPRGFFTMMGQTIAEVAAALESAGADVIGSNCGNGIDRMIEITREFRASTRLPILIQSNAGIPETKGNRVVYPETPEYFSDRVEQMLAAGASIMGGCCGTTPVHIRAMRKVLDAR